MGDSLFHLLPLLALTGAIAGVLAGLLGVGGGTILVPALFHFFVFFGYEPGEVMHLAVGTSLAAIVATGISSARAHYKKGAVRFDVAKLMVPGLVTGVAAGTMLASHIQGDSLRITFVILMFLIALMMLFDPVKLIKKEYSLRRGPADMASFAIGIFAALMGVGGATLSVPYMTLSRIPVHQAVGTAAFLGIIVAIPAALGFIIIGWHANGLPPYSLGYVSVLAWITIVPFSMICAPFGAKLAHSLPVGKLRRIFALFLLLVAASMLYK